MDKSDRKGVCRMNVNIESIKDNIIQKINNIDSLMIILFVMVLSLKCNCLIIDIIVITLMAFLCIFTKIEKLMFILIFMFFFEAVAKIDMLGGSIARLTLAICFIRIVIEIINNKIKFSKKNIAILLLFSLLLFVSILTNKNIIASGITYLNIITLVLFNAYFSSFLENDEIELLYDNIKRVIALSVFFSVIYGLVTNNFFIEQRSGYENKRFNGVKDPNYMAMYLNIGLIFTLSCKSFVYKKSQVVLVITLIVGLILTKSMSGIILNSLTILIYLLLFKKNNLVRFVKQHKKKVIVISTIVLTTFMIVSGSLINNYSKQTHVNEYGVEVGNNRVSDILVSFKEKDYDRLTSGRTVIWRDYFKYINNKSVLNKVIGDGLIVDPVYSSYWGKKMFSHNTYIDLLNSMGILGLVLTSIFVFVKIKKNKIFNFELQNENFEYRLLMFILLLYGMMLSIYPERIILFLFLL